MVNYMSVRHGPPGSDRQLREYNFEHFWAKHMLADIYRTARVDIPLQPGDAAPDFELESTDGQRTAVSDFAGRPVLVHIGNGT